MSSDPFDGFSDALKKGLVEIVGEEWGGAVCPPGSLTFSDWMEGVDKALLAQFGVRSSEGIAFRSGRCAFNAFVQAKGLALGIATLNFRLQPVLQRIRAGFQSVCKAVADSSGMVLTINEDEESYRIQGVHPATLAPFFFAGFFQEYLLWASNGKVFLYTLERFDTGEWELRFTKTPFNQ